MPLVTTAVLVAAAAWHLKLSTRYVIAAAWLNRRRAAPTPAPADLPYVVILVAALQEQTTLEPTLEALDALDYPLDRLRVAVVTTERESARRRADRERIATMFPDNGTARDGTAGIMSTPDAAGDLARRFAAQLAGTMPAVMAAELAERLAVMPADVRAGEALRYFDAVPTTAEVARRLCEKGRFRRTHLHHPDSDADKCAQLSYAVDELTADADPAAASGTYIGICDADANLHSGAVAALARAVARRKAAGRPGPSMLQEVPLYLRRPQAADTVAARPVSEHLLRAHTLLMLRRCLAVEVYRPLVRGWIHAWLPRWFATLAEPVVYGIGAGMFVRLDVLRSIGLFTPPTDDLTVGYKLWLRGADIEPLPVFGLAERYSTVRALAQSHALVAYGSFGVVGLRPVGPRQRARWLMLLLKEGADTLWWFTGPLVLLTSGVVHLVAGGPLWPIGVALGALFLAAALGAATWRDAQREWADVVDGFDRATPGALLLGVAMAPVGWLVNWLGPLTLAVRLAAAGLRRERIGFWKTGR